MEFITSKGLSIKRHGDTELLYVYPKSLITDEVRTYVRENRHQFLEILPVEIEEEKLGDWTERQLKKIGVTPERYVQVKKLFGLAPTCGCDSRKKWLNGVSDWWRGVNSDS